MSSSQAVEVTRWLYDEGLSQGRVMAFGDFVEPDLVWHTPSGDLGAEAFREMLVGASAQLPDLNVVVHDRIAEGDRVVTRFAMSWQTADGTRINPVEGVSIDRESDGRLVERWDHGEVVAVMAQLGLVTPVGLAIGAEYDDTDWTTPTHVIDTVLEESQSVAVVGMSTDETKYAYAIPTFLQAAGFTVIPIHPTASEIAGVAAYASLGDLPEPVDVVQVFRPPEEAPAIAAAAVAIGAKALWLQKDLTSIEARHIAHEAGLLYVEDRCMGVEAARRSISKAPA